MTKARQPAVSADLLTLRSNVTRISAELADLLGGPLLELSSAEELAAAKKQIQQFKRNVDRHVKTSSNKINERQGCLRQVESPDPPTRERSQPLKDESASGFYNGVVTFGLGQMKDQFVPTIYEMLDDFPECNELGFCKVRVSDDVRRTVDLERMSECAVVNELSGHQSAAVALEDWGGPDELKGWVCSVFIAPGEDWSSPVSDFEFQDVQAAEAAVDPTELDWRDLFCSTVEGASESSEKPYLVIPTACTAEWRASTGLPPEPYVDCGTQLSQTAKKISGVHTPYEYISSAARSATGMHVEDAWLCSANIVLASAPKVWLIVPPDSLEALEKKVKEVLADRLRPARPYSQFVRHMDALLSPRLLDRWRIPYHIVAYRAGEMIVTLPGAYHEVLNVGPNYAQAVNFAMSDWSGPPKHYRFYRADYPIDNPPTAAHFEIQEKEQEVGEQDVEENDEEQSQEQNKKEYSREDQDEDEQSSEEQDQEDDEEQSENIDEREPEDHEDKVTKNRTEELGRVVESDERTGPTAGDNWFTAPEAYGTNIPSNAPIFLNDPIAEANASRSDPIKDLNHHTTTTLTNPLKRHALSIDDSSESEADSTASDKDNISQSETLTMGLSNGSTASSHPVSSVTQPKFERWRDCVFYAAENGGFNAEGVVQAFQNAPANQPVESVLRVLQYICEVANIPLLLRIRAHLLADPAARLTIEAPATPNNGHVRKIAQLHQNIGILDRISWAAQYQLAVHQLQYYQQFEAIVKERQAAAKRATNERRNHKKRLGSRGVVTESGRPRSVQTKAVVKEETVALIVQQGASECAAKKDLEHYLHCGKIFHLLLGYASPSLLGLFPLVEAMESRPSLRLLEHGPPDNVLELGRPISISS